MPRKRKGPKREPSEGDVATEPNAAASAVAGPSTSSLAHGQRTSPPFQRQATHEPQTTNGLSHGIDNRTHKRTRFLAEAEEDRLGKLVAPERWIESVGHGRGAAVCICAHVAQATSASDSFLLELICLHPNDPSQTSKLSVMFQGQLAPDVSEPLLLLHKLGPPAVVYLSGFAADLLTPEQGLPRAVFQQENVVLKMSPQPPAHDPTAPTSAIWIEQLASHPALAAASHSTSVVQQGRSMSAPSIPHPAASSNRVERLSPPRPPNTVANPAEPSPPSQLSDWFSTPTPNGDQLHQHAMPANSAHTAAVVATTNLAPPQAQSNQLGQSSTSVARPVQAVVKREGLTRSSSSPNPGRASSRQPSAAPPPPRPNAPHVKPRRMGNCLYTPISMVRDGERASIVGVVVAAGDPRRSTSGTRDLSIKITVADASCLSGTGYAKELARSMTVMLFAQSSERIPQTIKPGHIIAVRGVQIQMFSGKPQAVGKSAGQWSWAVYDPVSGDVHASSNFPLASHTPPECSADEMEHFRDMANWFSELQGVDANIVTRSSRPTVKLQDIAENMFFDTVVEVLKVYTHTVAPDLYVTDYTNHTLFYRGNDKYLRLESDLSYPDDTDGWGHVFQISLWDSHATIAEGLQTGDIIRIQNVRPKLNPRGLLTGGLGSSTDSGIKIRTLKATDEARIELEKRRARFLETLFAAEEEALADQVERQHGQSSQQRQEQQQQQQNAAEQTAVSAANVTTPGPSVGVRQQGSASDRAATTAVEASPAGTTQPPFPTPAQRQLRAAHDATPSRTANPTVALGNSNSGNRDTHGNSQDESLDLKPGMLMGPPETVEDRKPLIRCNAPASIPLTALATLQTTSLCPGMYKVKARIISTNPTKVEQWARVECKACKRLLPLDQRFCIKCGDEEGVTLSYCLRFAVMLEEVDAEFMARKQEQRTQGGDAAQGEIKKVAIPLLFHGQSSEVLLPCVDAKALFNGERSCIKTLRRFHNRLLHPKEYAKEPEQVLAVYSFPSKEAGRTVRRFAALKELNVLYNPVDLL